MLLAKGLVKTYGGVKALSEVDFSIGEGEVVGLIGENGAGKSTMIKILAGLVKPDSGEITMDGQPLSVSSVKEAGAQGIAFIFQERNVLDNLDVAGNVLLGSEPKKLGFLLDRRAMRQQAAVALNKIGLDISPDASAAPLSNAQRQLVEIARALTSKVRLIIMDEPSASLSGGETEKLLELIVQLKTEGVSVVYVSHRLDEVTRIADRVVGLRDGKNAGGLEKSQINSKAMVQLMVGREIDRGRPEGHECGDPRLVVNGLRTRRYPNHEVSFHICRGEVVGLAGLVGAGRTEVALTLFGIESPVGGEVTLDDVKLDPGSPASAIDSGVFLVPEDRRRQGALLTMSIKDNIALPNLDLFARLGLVKNSKERSYAEEMETRMTIKTSSIDNPAGSLSGGNQQKVVLAKWLGMNPKCLILDEPTIGIDVGARSEIYRLIREMAKQGVSILMISSDLEEILHLSDRILVMHEGRLAGELDGKTADEASVMNLAVGFA